MPLLQEKTEAQKGQVNLSTVIDLLSGEAGIQSQDSQLQN